VRPGLPHPMGQAADPQPPRIHRRLQALQAGRERGGIHAGRDVLSFLHTFSLLLHPSLQSGAAAQPKPKAGAMENGERDDDLDMDLEDGEDGAGPQAGPTHSPSQLLHSFWAVPHRRCCKWGRCCGGRERWGRCWS